MQKLLQCSTPFGIKEGFTVLAAVVRQRGFGCSTPFGIKEGFTLNGRLSVFQIHECSTPFGIKEGFTAARAADRIHRLGAQRLSASKRDSRGV